MQLAPAASATALAALLLLRGGCDDDGRRRDVGGPCTRPKDCEEGLVCAAGVCVDPDAGSPDAAVREAGDGASFVPDASSVPDASDAGCDGGAGCP